MTTPQRAVDALTRAVDAQRAQREAAQESSNRAAAQREEGIERADSDRQE